MSNVPDTYRTHEQVLTDLGRTIGFSASALEENHKGRLAIEQMKSLAPQFFRPLIMAAAMILGPLFFAGTVVGSATGGSFLDGIVRGATVITQPGDLIETYGRVRVISFFAAGVAFIGLGLWKATQVPLPLLFDMLGGAVAIKVGRVAAHERELGRKRSGDPIEIFYYEMKDERFDVPRKAISALDDGGSYRVYLTPRSRLLVAIEPNIDKVETPAAAAPAPPVITREAFGRHS